MKAEILTIGDEILIGQISNSNSAWIARQLNLAGINVIHMTTVADDATAIMNALTDAGNRAALVMITGGLGPTRDDITKKTFAEFFGAPLENDAAVLSDVEGFFAQRGLEASEVNRMQALVPRGCTVIRNAKGTAPGMWMEKNGSTFISMPGVPHEMIAMMENNVLPSLKEKFHFPSIHHTTILTQGIGESALAELISKWEDGLTEKSLKLAYLPQPGLVRLRLSGTGNDKDKLRDNINSEIDKLLPLIENYFCGREEYGGEPMTLEREVGTLLRDQNKTLALAESCTGGYISSLFTAMPGASEFFRGAVIPYANIMKHVLLNVDNELFTTVGAVSKECVEQLARNTQKRFDSDFSLSVSGIAGPSGATAEKPVGTIWVAVADRNKVYPKKFQFGSDRQRNIMMASNAAMQMLRKLILKRLS